MWYNCGMLEEASLALPTRCNYTTEYRICQALRRAEKECVMISPDDEAVQLTLDEQLIASTYEEEEDDES